MCSALQRALAALEQRAWQTAREAAREAQQAQPEHVAPLLVLTEAHLGLENWARAKVVAQQAARLAPQRPEPWLLVARCGQHEQDLPRAITAIERALAAAPDHASVWRLLRELQALVGDDETRELFDGTVQRLLSARRADAEAALDDRARQQRFFKVLEWMAAREVTAAHYETLLHRWPDDVTYLNNYASCLRFLGREDEARVAMQRALDQERDDGRLWLNLGELEKSVGQFEAAVEAFRQGTTLLPQWAQAWFALASAHYERQEMDAAMEALATGLALEPQSTYGLNLKGLIETQVGHAVEAAAAYEACRQASPFHAGFHSNFLLASNYDPGRSHEEVAAHHRAFAPHFRETRRRSDFEVSLEPGKRLRVGFVSGDFAWHSVAFYLEPLFPQFDRAEIEVIAYSRVLHPDTMTRAIRRSVDQWREVANVSLEALAQQMRADALDIAVDLSGHTGGNVLSVFGWRVAPVQVHWLGYPNTTGLATMDYRLVDAVTEPPGEFQRFSQERLVCLPDGFHVHRLPGELPEVAPLPALANGYVTFGSFNNAAKLNPGVIALWARLMQAVPGSRLMLKNRGYALARTREELTDAFGKHGIVADRLDFVAHTPNTAAHLRKYAAVDVALDPFPYNGTTTTLEALTMGVPVLTLLGDRHCARVSASLLYQVGLPEFVAEEAEQFVARGAELVGNLAMLAEVRPSLRARLAASPLQDFTGFARKLAVAFRGMWLDFCAERGVEVTAARDGQAAAAATLTNTGQQRLAQAWADRGCELLGHRHPERAREVLRAAVEIDPARPGIWTNLAVAEEQTGRRAAAVEAVNQALRLAPDFAPALNNRARLAKAAGDLESALATFTAAFQQAPEDPVVRSNLLYCLPFVPGLTQAEIDQHHAQLSQGFASPARHEGGVPAMVSGSLDGPLRVGYVTPDVRDHPVCDFLGPVLRAHDPEAVEPFLYALRAAPPSEQRAWAGPRTTWREVAGWRDEAIAALFQADALDVLVDLAGHTAGGRPTLFTRRHAPVQVSWLGYPGKTGLPVIDFTIGDDVLFPDLADASVYRLPHGAHCYDPLDGPLPGVPRAKASAEIFTFGAPHQLAKVNDVTLSLWAAALEAVPQARLSCRASALGDAVVAESFRARLRQAGIAPDRVDLHGWGASRVVRWAWWAEVDVMLDAFPYHGTTTTCEALTAGVPVITLPGETTASRVGPSLLTQLGCREWIARDGAGWKRLARALAEDAPGRAAWRTALPLRLRGSSLGEAVGFTRGWETALHEMRKTREKGLLSGWALAV